MFGVFTVFTLDSVDRESFYYCSVGCFWRYGGWVGIFFFVVRRRGFVNSRGGFYML